MNTQEQKLRKEWELRVHGGHFVDQLYPFSPNSEVADDIADWWISRLSQAIQTERNRAKDLVIDYFAGAGELWFDYLGNTKEQQRAEAEEQLSTLLDDITSSKEESHE